jgi:hypothetical protein
MRWMRKILSCEFTKEKEEEIEPKSTRVYSPACGWGTLNEFKEDGTGHIEFDCGGGQIIRDWNHFLNMITIIETQD